MYKVFLSLGSSLGNREQNLQDALYYTNKLLGKIITLSNIYETEPWGFTDENLFLNQVILIETNLLPLELLKNIKLIEKKLHRIKSSENYEARTIDIDILYFENQIFYSEILQIPHKHLHKRKFVLVPLSEIAPEFIHPLLQKSTNDLLKICLDKTDIKKLSDFTFYSNK